MEQATQELDAIMKDSLKRGEKLKRRGEERKRQDKISASERKAKTAKARRT